LLAGNSFVIKSRDDAHAYALVYCNSSTW